MRSKGKSRFIGLVHCSERCGIRFSLRREQHQVKAIFRATPKLGQDKKRRPSWIIKDDVLRKLEKKWQAFGNWGDGCGVMD
jgi:hypothetical protein